LTLIADVQRGRFMPDLICYLFGPGKHNEHVNQHLIAGYDEAVFSAADRLWQSEPGVQRRVAAEARELGWQIEYPHSRWGAEVPRGHVWHCSLSIRADEGRLSDTQWTAAAHAVVDAMGFSTASGKASCRWVAVRHGLSRDGNDHIHLAVNLVREDGTKATTWNDYRTVGRVCTELEERFGLEHVAGRMSGRSVPEPTRADREISAKRGEPEPLRARLERKVRACAAAARSEAEFVALARANGLLIRPRHASGERAQIIGYAVAERGGRTAYSTRTGRRGPVWFGGGKLATDLTLPQLRERWEIPGGDTADARLSALAAWSAFTLIPDHPGVSPPGRSALPSATRLTTAYGQIRELSGTSAGSLGEGACTLLPGPQLAIPAADALAAAALAWEQGTAGPLCRAARHMARAAQQSPHQAGRAQAATAIRDVASVFITTALAGITDSSFGALLLMTEVARLVDTCAAAHAGAHDARKANVLVQSSLSALTVASATQARSVLKVPGAQVRTAATHEGGVMMSEATHEDELLRHLTQAGVLGAQLTRAGVEAFSKSGNRRPAEIAEEAARLAAAGYTRETRHDGHLRDLLGEQRWAWYADDPARIICAAMITDGERAGHDMSRLLTTAVRERPWENDPVDASRSVARVLAFRINRQLQNGKFQRPASPGATHYTSQADADPLASAAASSPATDAQARTPYDGRLRELLGDERWRKYARDTGRAQVAQLILQAEQQGCDVNAMLAHVVSSRPFEDDPVSPARRIAPVLHHRIRAALESGELFGQGDNAGSRTVGRPDSGSGPALPAEVARAISHGAAPVSAHPRPEGSSYSDPAQQARSQPCPPAARPQGSSRD
jgi:hypothetical protein